MFGVLKLLEKQLNSYPDELRQKYNAIEWRAIAGMRDR